MGSLFAFSSEFELGLPDSTLEVVEAALEVGFLRFGFVTICSWYADESCYVAVDVSRFFTREELESVGRVGEGEGIAIRAVYDDGADHFVAEEFVEDIVDVMGELDGWLILDADDHIVCDLEVARRIKVDAVRFSVIQSHPGH